MSTLGPPGPPAPRPTARRRVIRVPAALGQPGSGPAARGRVMSTGTALTLIAIGAILWFAVTPSAIPGLNVNTVGIILFLIGVVGLVLPMAASRRTLRSVSPWLSPSGHDNPKVDEIKRAAAADDARIEEDDKFFDPNGPGSREDDL